MLIASDHEIVGVVTQPDKPSGRGLKIGAAPVKELAMANGLNIMQPASVKTEEFVERLKALKPDVAVVVAYGKILPAAVLSAPVHGSLNIHGSLLPAYRGAAPIQWAIINGEQKTGVTIMQMDEGMDTGPVIAMKELPILEDDDTVSLGNMLSYVGAELMGEVLTKLQQDGKLEATAQDDSKASKAPLIRREMARIDWSQPFERVIGAVHGFQPWPKAYTTIEGKELKILGAEGCAADWVPGAALDENVPVGTVVEIFKTRGFVVKTGGEKGLVLITRVQPPGKPEMGAHDYVNGGALDVGTKLS